jgi:hypothetical protein
VIAADARNVISLDVTSPEHPYLLKEKGYLDIIKRCFSQPTVPEIMKALSHEKNPWAKQGTASLSQGGQRHLCGYVALVVAHPKLLCSVGAFEGAVPSLAGRHSPSSPGGLHQGHGRRPSSRVPHRPALHGSSPQRNGNASLLWAPLTLSTITTADARLCRGRHGAHFGEEEAKLEPHVC